MPEARKRNGQESDRNFWMKSVKQWGLLHYIVVAFLAIILSFFGLQVSDLMPWQTVNQEVDSESGNLILHLTAEEVKQLKGVLAVSGEILKDLHNRKLTHGSVIDHVDDKTLISQLHHLDAKEAYVLTKLVEEGYPFTKEYRDNIENRLREIEKKL